MPPMSRAQSKIPPVAPKKKGYDAERTLRYPSRLKEPLELLALINHRGANDEIVVAIEERIARNRAAIAEAKARKKS